MQLMDTSAVESLLKDHLNLIDLLTPNIDELSFITNRVIKTTSDIEQSVETLKDMDKPYGVVVNKVDIGNDDMFEYLRENNIELLKKIPFSREIAENYSKGILYSSADKGLRTECLDLF